MRPKCPGKDQLQSVLPLEVWEEAERQALRSPLMRFRAGAAIWHPSSGVVAGGTAHHSSEALSTAASIHAEHHALRRSGRVEGAEIVVVAIGNCDNWTHSSCPCVSCAGMLQSRGISVVHYALWNGKNWQVVSESPEELVKRAETPVGRMARKQRIPSLILP